ncbi:hypothetical protein GTQ99_09925 [Kineococcus sp. T13]|uniref:hypothetical protein n=1 Tax=Kineococcus vitellinus TaxID=2696565 RepID=UPI001411D08A|nr:hypothetical protein [Kineococcus vitellinus]NAZ75728.1 hypothetical protein [Kineococcus vitellinus]
MSSYDDHAGDAGARAPHQPGAGHRSTNRRPTDPQPAADLLRRTSLLTWAGLGALTALTALLPWLATGARLPLQNLWREPTSPADMPRVLLPFSQYALTQLLSLLVTGHALAGLLARLLARTTRLRWPRRSVLALAAGVLGVQLLAAAQTTLTVAGGLSARPASALYLAALLAALSIALAVGLLVLRLLLAASRAAVVVGVSLSAVLGASWLSSLLTPFTTAGGAAASGQHWLPAVLVGAVIAWSGVRSAGRVLAAAGGLALLWVLPAALTAVTSAAGFRLLLPHPRELAGYGAQVFQAALLTPGLVLPPLLLALVVAAGGSAAHHLLTHRPAVRRRGDRSR